jgi:hypothetical protein
METAKLQRQWRCSMEDSKFPLVKIGEIDLTRMSILEKRNA